MAIKKVSGKEAEKIWSFIGKQTVLNFATSQNGIPWCASCYFALDDENKCLVFKSGEESRHMQEAFAQEYVAGTILPDKLLKGIVIGVQYQGKLTKDEDLIKKGSKVYYSKYPFAKVMDGDMVVVELTHVKLTDNKLGIGKRLVWEKE